MRVAIGFVLVGVLVLGCAESRPGTVSTTPEAVIDVRAPALASLDAGSRDALERYLTGNPRWSFLQEARPG